jgi:uncharacterized protein YcaQ
LERRNEPLSPRRRSALGSKPTKTLKSVLAAVAERGPLMSRDFEDLRGRARAWWNRKPARVALDWLFYTGYLMVDRRVNFQCMYDLTERVLPRAANGSKGDLRDWTRWAVSRGVECLGIGTARHIADYYRLSASATKVAIQGLIEDQAIVAVEVEGWKDIAFVRTEDLKLIDEIDAGAHHPTTTALLSPFDNLIWCRQRVEQLFQFSYRSEMYTPIKRQDRVHGYYVMPILHRGELIGRLDPKINRTEGTLIIRSLSFEKGVSVTSSLLGSLKRALREFAQFHGCKRVRCERRVSARYRELLSLRLR